MKYNIATKIEQAQRSLTLTKPAKMEGSPAGWASEVSYDGTWDALEEYAENVVAQGSATQQISATLTRKNGGMATLIVRRENYLSPDEEEEEDDTTGGESGGTEEEEEAGTEISIEVVAQQESILNHPLFKDLHETSLEMKGLRKLAAGASLDEIFIDAGQEVTVAEAVANAKGWHLVCKASSFYVPHVMVTVTTPAKASGSTSISEFFSRSSPPGISTPSGYNWMLLGGGKQIVNGKAKVVKKYMLSGPGGWDPEIYP